MAGEWDKVKSFDDLVPQGKREIISELEKKIKENEKCPYLKKIENFFYYCGKDLDEKKTQEYQVSSPNNPICKRWVDIVSLQFFCWYNYKSCITYLGKHKYPDS